jgi:hypothetical protein
MSSREPIIKQTLITSFSATAAGGAGDVCALPCTFSFYLVPSGKFRLAIASTANVNAANQQFSLTYTVPTGFPGSLLPVSPAFLDIGIISVKVGAAAGNNRHAMVQLQGANIVIYLLGAPTAPGPLIGTALLAGDVGGAVSIASQGVDYVLS